MYTVKFVLPNDEDSMYPCYWRAENTETRANAHALTAVDALADLVEQEGN
jgi:hypothetical protein